MAKMKMRTKIMLGFASVLVLLAVVGVVAVSFLQQATNGFTEYRNWARNSNLVADLQENMLMARMQVKDFIISGDQLEERQFREYFDQVATLVEEAKSEITAGSRAPLVAEIDEKIGDYGDSFDRVVQHQAQRDTVVNDTIQVVAPRIEQDLTDMLEDAETDGEYETVYEIALALRNHLLAENSMNRYLSTNAEEDEQSTIAELSSLQARLAELARMETDPERRALVEDAITQAERFETAFASVVQIIYDRNDTIDNQLDVIGPDIAETGHRILASVVADQNALGPQLQASMRLASVIVIGTAIAAVVGGIFLALLITRGILRQLGEDPMVIEEIAQRVAKGDLEINTDDEGIGVYKSVQEMVEALRYKADVVEQIAQRDLTVSIKKASDKDALGESLITMRDALHDLLSQTRVAIEQVAAGSGQVSSASQELSQGATEQASSLEEISSSVNEINGQSRQNADNSVEANNIARQAADNARSGNEQMSKLKDAMANISNSSGEIKKVVKVIDDIAFQINLLALNANVEAARAGKYGKGFAVVAEEVRNLAVRSAEAVQETTAMVEESVRNIENGNELTDLTATQLAEIVTGADRVAEFLEEIAAASKEQAQAVEQITEGLGQIDQVTQSNTASAEESASAAEELASQAEQLRASIADFRLHESANGRYLGAPAQGAAATRRVAENGHDASAKAEQSRTQPREKVAHGARAAAKPAPEQSHASGDNGRHASERPEDVIRLDDDEFDRF